MSNWRRFARVGAAVVAAAVLLMAVGLPVGAQRNGMRSSCVLTPGKWADPARLFIGDWTTVTLTTTTHCPLTQLPLHIVLMLDASNSMIPNGKLRDMQNAATRFVDEIDFDVSKAGVVSFKDKGYVEAELTDRKGRVQGAISGLTTAFGTDFEGGMARTEHLLRDGRNEFVRDHPGQPLPIEIAVILSDGQPYPPGRTGTGIANKMKSDGVTIFSICVGNDCDQRFMRSFASRASYYFSVRSSGGLISAFRKIRDQVSNVRLKEILVRDVVPDNMRYIPGSADPPTYRIVDRELRWRWTTIPPEGITITYQLEPLEVGTWPTNVEAIAEFKDVEERVGEAVFPVPTVEVLAPPTPTQTPSATPTPTPTATPSTTVTPKATDTAVPTPTPTPTAAPRPIYLPLALVEVCDVRSLAVDVALVIDVSSSMNVPTRAGGQAKRDAARGGARAFIAQLRPGRDRVAVIAFADRALTLAPLTDDLAAASAALDALPRLEGTRIHAGLAAAVAELAAAGTPAADRARAILLVTDGRPTRGDAGDVLAAAEMARAAGLVVFAIGLGADADPVLLRAVAGDDARYHAAAEAEDLDAIYRRLARDVPCPSGRHDLGAPWP